MGRSFTGLDAPSVHEHDRGGAETLLLTWLWWTYAPGPPLRADSGRPVLSQLSFSALASRPHAVGQPPGCSCAPLPLGEGHPGLGELERPPVCWPAHSPEPDEDVATPGARPQRLSSQARETEQPTALVEEREVGSSGPPPPWGESVPQEELAEAGVEAEQWSEGPLSSEKGVPQSRALPAVWGQPEPPL